MLEAHASCDRWVPWWTRRVLAETLLPKLAMTRGKPAGRGAYTSIAACAAASRAIGTRKGLQLM